MKNYTVYKTYLALNGYDLLTLSIIERSKQIAFDVYQRLSKRPDMMRHENKRLIKRLYNPQGTSYSPQDDNFVGYIRLIEHKYTMALDKDEQSSFANISDYFDTKVEEDTAMMRKVIVDEYMSATDIDPQALGDLWYTSTHLGLHISMCKRIFENLTVRTDKEIDSYATTTVICRDVNSSESRIRGFVLDDSLIVGIRNVICAIFKNIIKNKVIAIHEEVGQTELAMSIANKQLAFPTLMYAAAEGGLDLTQPIENRMLTSDVNELRERVTSFLQKENLNK